MTVYNRRYRCWQHPSKKPTETITHRGNLLGKCAECKQWFRLYTNGNVVMHKRESLAKVLT